MKRDEKINYVEFPSRDIEKTKEFFTKVFDFTFTDFGAEYTSFADEGIDGGFFKADMTVNPREGSALIVFYSKDLERTMEKIENSEGKISHPIFQFPGGRRFHFQDPTGNEYAVWSDLGLE